MNVTKLFSSIFLILGILFTGWGVVEYIQDNMPNRYAFADFQQASSVEVVPVQIGFKNTFIPLVVGKIVDGVWPLSNNSAVYLDGSGQIGKTGNAVIYGHDTNKVFSGLKKLIPGDQITLRTKEGDEYIYQIELVQTITPDQTHILAPTSDERITLYTCEGIFSQKRRVLVAIRVIG